MCCEASYEDGVLKAIRSYSEHHALPIHVPPAPFSPAQMQWDEKHPPHIQVFFLLLPQERKKYGYVRQYITLQTAQ